MAVVAAIALLTGCVQQQAMPASVARAISDIGFEFKVAQPPAGVLSDTEALAAMRQRGGQAMFQSRAVSIFGVLTCSGPDPDCDVGFGTRGSRPVWLLVFPERTGPDGAVGYAVFDLVTGPQGGWFSFDPR
jgi:hypothetical protein